MEQPFEDGRSEIGDESVDSRSATIHHGIESIYRALDPFIRTSEDGQFQVDPDAKPSHEEMESISNELQMLDVHTSALRSRATLSLDERIAKALLAIMGTTAVST